MADRIQLRRDTATNWASVNPILADGEIGFEHDTGQFKIGDGITTYTALPYNGMHGPQGDPGPQGPEGPPGPATAWGNIPGILTDQTDLQSALVAKAPKASPAFTGDASFAGAINEAVYTLSGNAPTLDPSLGTVQLHVLTGPTTYSDAMLSGQYLTLMIDDGAGELVTWPSLTWVNNGGSAPTLSLTDYTVIALWKAGTTLFGALLGDGS